MSVDEDIYLKRDLLRVPQKFLDYLLARDGAVPVIVASSLKGTFGSYYIKRDDKALPEVVRQAEWWVAPDGPFRRGNVVKAARYFLLAVRRGAVEHQPITLRAVSK